MAAATAVDAYGGVEVGGWVQVEKVEPQQQATQVLFPLVAACPGEDLHHDGLADRELPAMSYERGQPLINRTPGGTVVLHPGGGVDQDHATLRGGTSAGGSLIACAPRMPSASSRVMGWPARCRSAKSTASVFVRTPWRSMIAWTYLSSISMFVRTLAIHLPYTWGVRHVYTFAQRPNIAAQPQRAVPIATVLVWL